MKFFGAKKNKVEPETEATGPLDHIKKTKSKAESTKSDGRPKALLNVANLLSGKKKDAKSKKKGNAAQKLQAKIKNDRRLKPVR